MPFYKTCQVLLASFHYYDFSKLSARAAQACEDRFHTVICWWLVKRMPLSKSRSLKVFGNTKLQVAIENPCSMWVLKIPSSFQNKYDQLGDSSLCTPSGRYQSIYPIALKYMCS